jgi:hypothetical protein
LQPPNDAAGKYTKALGSDADFYGYEPKKFKKAVEKRKEYTLKMLANILKQETTVESNQHRIPGKVFEQVQSMSAVNECSQ